MSRARSATTGAITLLSALVLAACGTQPAGQADQGSTPAAADPGAVVLTAATTTAKSGTAAVDMKAVMSLGGVDQTMTATGKTALDGSKADLTMTLPGVRGAGVSMHELVVGSHVYVQITGMPGLPQGWLTMPDSALQSLGLSGPASGTSATDVLSVLRSLGTVTEVGPEQVNGVATTHFHGEVAPSAILGKVSASAPAALKDALGSDPVPIEVYVDGAQHVVRVSEKLTVTVSGKKVAESVQVDFSDFGVPFTVSAPAHARSFASALGG